MVFAPLRRRGPEASRPSSRSAQALAKQGDKAAFEPLEKAAALVPMATGAEEPARHHGSPCRAGGRARRTPSGPGPARKRMHNAIDAARRLAELAATANDEPNLAFAYERMLSRSIRSTRRATRDWVGSRCGPQRRHRCDRGVSERRSRPVPPIAPPPTATSPRATCSRTGPLTRNVKRLQRSRSRRASSGRRIGC